MENLMRALQETIQFLRVSQESVRSSLTVTEIIQQLEGEIAKMKNFQPIDKNRLSFLFAPTGSIQDTSIDNGWGQEFLEISRVVDNYL